jgi:predicted transcriptional regulator
MLSKGWFTMSNRTSSSGSYHLTLKAARVADLMSPNVTSIREGATVEEAVAFLTDKGISAAPVIDLAGRPIGVLSKTDIITYDREKATSLTSPSHHHEFEYDAVRPRQRRLDLPIDENICIFARDLMTPAVFTIPMDAAAIQVIEQMLALHVHRLFVVDASHVLVGVVTTLDVFRRLDLHSSPGAGSS